MPKTRFRKEHLRSQKIAAGHLKSEILKFSRIGRQKRNFNFFLFAPNNPFSELFSKMTLNGSVSLFFFQN